MDASAFDCLLASRRLAQAQTESELEREWKAAQADFQKSWDRKGHQLIFLIHDDYGGIDDDSVTDVLGTIASLEKNHPVDIIIHTNGGYVLSTRQIADALVKRPNTTSFIPYRAMSGGTIVALATQRIHLGKSAILGPTDIQMGGVPARDIIQTAKDMGEGAPPGLRLAARDAERVLIGEAKKLCSLINRRHKGFMGWRGCTLASELTLGQMYHGEAIGFRQAKKMHMNVQQKTPKSVYGLMSVRLEQLRRLREIQSHITLVPQPASAAVSAAIET